MFETRVTAPKIYDFFITSTPTGKLDKTSKELVFSNGREA